MTKAEWGGVRSKKVKGLEKASIHKLFVWQKAPSKNTFMRNEPQKC